VFTGGFSADVLRKSQCLVRVALSLTPIDNPYQPVIVRGRVVERIEGDAD
jgi:hypothetical protein